MKTHFFLITILIISFSGCFITPRSSDTIYNRTKDIRFNGRISTLKGETMLSVTWKYSKQEIDKATRKQAEELQDCFRSEMVYDGKSQGAIHFLIKNYLCGTYAPLSSEPLTVKAGFPSRIIFHSMELNIISADDEKVLFESR